MFNGHPECCFDCRDSHGELTASPMNYEEVRAFNVKDRRRGEMINGIPFDSAVMVSQRKTSYAITVAMS